MLSDDLQLFFLRTLEDVASGCEGAQAMPTGGNLTCGSENETGYPCVVSSDAQAEYCGLEVPRNVATSRSPDRTWRIAGLFLCVFHEHTIVLNGDCARAL